MAIFSDFEWDDEKDAENRRKHRLPLAAGVTLFQGPTEPFEEIDDRADYGEERWITIGRSGPRVLYCAYMWREERHRIRSLVYAMPHQKKSERSRDDLRKIVDSIDWSAADALTEKERLAAALADPEAQPVDEKWFERAAARRKARKSAAE